MTTNNNIKFHRIQKEFYFSKINIKQFPKHVVNSNKQLRSKLSKEKQHFMHESKYKIKTMYHQK